MAYKIFRCSGCKNFNMSSAKRNSPCKYCRKIINVEKSKIYFQNENPTVVSKVLIKIKEEDFKRKDFFDGEDDFFTYEIDK